MRGKLNTENITRDHLSATRKMRRRRTDFPWFRGNVNDVDVIFGSWLRHGALVEFRAVSTWYDHIYCFIKEVISDTPCEKFLVKYKSTYLNKRL